MSSSPPRKKPSHRFVRGGEPILIRPDGAGTLLRAYVHYMAEDEPLLW